MSHKPTLVDRFMAETIIYGGMPTRRSDAAADLQRRGFPAKAVDTLAFGAKAVDLPPVEWADNPALKTVEGGE